MPLLMYDGYDSFPTYYWCGGLFTVSGTIACTSKDRLNHISHDTACIESARMHAPQSATLASGEGLVL